MDNQEQKYQIELTKQQLEFLRNVLEKHFRIILGQLDIGLRPILEDAIKRRNKKLSEEEEDEMENLLNNTITQLRIDFWGQTRGHYNGVHYSEETDTLIDMTEVIRHQLFLDSGRKKKGLVDEYPAMHWNQKQPLIKVKKAQDE